MPMGNGTASQQKGHPPDKKLLQLPSKGSLLGDMAKPGVTPIKPIK